MKVAVKEVCDICRRDLPVLGSANRSGNASVYRVRRTRWRFFSRLLAWQPTQRDDLFICGDCWEAVRQAAEGGGG